jgi:hypothetical protein
MMALLLSFLIGCVDGLRSLTGPAVVCWVAHFGWLHFAGTKLAFVDRPVTLIVFTVLAIVELVLDKLPSTPARTAPVGLIARIVLGGACGLAIATSAGISTLLRLRSPQSVPSSEHLPVTGFVTRLCLTRDCQTWPWHLQKTPSQLQADSSLFRVSKRRVQLVAPSIAA